MRDVGKSITFSVKQVILCTFSYFYFGFLIDYGYILKFPPKKIKF